MKPLNGMQCILLLTNFHSKMTAIRFGTRSVRMHVLCQLLNSVFPLSTALDYPSTSTIEVCLQICLKSYFPTDFCGNLPRLRTSQRTNEPKWYGRHKFGYLVWTVSLLELLWIRVKSLWYCPVELFTIAGITVLSSVSLEKYRRTVRRLQPEPEISSKYRNRQPLWKDGWYYDTDGYLCNIWLHAPCLQRWWAIFKLWLCS